MISIKHRFSNTTLCEIDVLTVRECAEKGSANLRGADLGEKGKILPNGYFTAGQLGSRNDMLKAFHTDKGVWIETGCFFDSLEKFREAVTKTHGDSNYAFEYLGICNFIEHHFRSMK